MSFDPNRSSCKTPGKPQPPPAANEGARVDPARIPQRNTGPTATGTQSSSATAAAQAPVDPFPEEKRRHPRFKCEGNLELKTDGSTIRTWATFTDISTAGCYIEMMTTFPVGTRMDLQLGMNGFLVNGAAIVRATYPFLGMGIEFTNLSQNSQEQLDAMIASLTAGRLLRVTPAAKKINLPPISDPVAVVNALEQFFETQPSLSSEEFVRLVASSQKR